MVAGGRWDVQGREPQARLEGGHGSQEHGRLLGASQRCQRPGQRVDRVGLADAVVPAEPGAEPFPQEARGACMIPSHGRGAGEPTERLRYTSDHLRRARRCEYFPEQGLRTIERAGRQRDLGLV